MSRVGLPDKYAEAVKSNHLNGRALLFNDPVDLKEVLQMTLGEWTTFKITFLTDDSSAGGHDESRPALTQPTMTLCPSSPLHAAACKTSNV